MKSEIGTLTMSLAQAYAQCEALVRDADKDRFLAGLFAPADRRRHLFALYAFNLEIARVRELVREPLPGEMRLQWWRDALAGAGRGDVQAHPVAHAFLDTVAACRLPNAPLLDLIEARSFDLYPDPMPSMDALFGYVRKTSSALIALASLVLAGADDPAAREASEPAGIASGIVRLLQAFPAHAARGQVYVPLDLLGRHDVDVADVFAGRTTPSLGAALAELRTMARTAFAQLRERAELSAAAVPAFLPVVLVPPLLRRLDDAEPFAPVELPQWRRQWVLWRAARCPRAYGL
jgi:phytoene synthase